MPTPLEVMEHFASGEWTDREWTIAKDALVKFFVSAAEEIEQFRARAERAEAEVERLRKSMTTPEDVCRVCGAKHVHGRYCWANTALNPPDGEG